MTTYTRAYPKVYIELESAPLDAADPGDWIEITRWVRSVQFQYGRSQSSEDFQPGSGQVQIDNRDGQFDPLNTAGPHYGKLKLRRKIRVDYVSETYDGDTGSVIGSTYEQTIAYGWVTSWGAQPRFRNFVDTTVTWTDALGLLANHDMPESVWDYRIKSFADAGEVVVWHKWDDENYVALDSSGNGYHGQYTIAENGSDPGMSQQAPVSVVRAGRSDPVIPACDRPGLSFGKMIAEAGQPANAPDNGWRFPSVVCSSATNLWVSGADFTVETWVRYRAAYSLSAAGLASSTTARRQMVAWWGTSPYFASRGLGFDTTSSVAAWGAYYGELIPGDGFFFWIPLTAGGSFVGADEWDDNQVHHVVWSVTRDTSPAGHTVEVYVDGVNVDTITFLDLTAPLPSRTMNIGYQHQLLWPSPNPALDMAFGLELGDVVAYNKALTSTEVLGNYRAGRYGNLSASADLDASSAFDQAITMVGYGGANAAYIQTDKTVAAGKLGGNVVDYLRLLARSVDGLMWQARDGELRIDGENWKRGMGASVQFTLYDNQDPLTTSTGYERVTYTLDDGLLANSWAVSFDGGTRTYEDATSIAEHGRYEASVSTLLVNPGDAEGLAQFRALQRATPQVEIGQVTFNLDEGSMPFVLSSCEIGTRIRVESTRPNGTSVAGVDDEYWIMGIAHEIDGFAGVDEGRPFSPYALGYPGMPNFGSWRITLTLTKADWPVTPFVIGTSELDGTETIWY